MLQLIEGQARSIDMTVDGYLLITAVVGGEVAVYRLAIGTGALRSTRELPDFALPKAGKKRGPYKKQGKRSPTTRYNPHCSFCKKIFRGPGAVQDLVAHQTKEHKGEGFKCEECGISYRKPQFKTKHITQMHGK